MWMDRWKESVERRNQIIIPFCSLLKISNLLREKRRAGRKPGQLCSGGVTSFKDVAKTDDCNFKSCLRGILIRDGIGGGKNNRREMVFLFLFFLFPITWHPLKICQLRKSHRSAKSRSFRKKNILPFFLSNFFSTPRE